MTGRIRGSSNIGKYRAEEDKFREMQRRKREEVDSVRRVNSSLMVQIQQEAKHRDNSPMIPNDYGALQQRLALQQKRDKQKIMKIAQQLDKIKYEQDKNNRKAQIQIGQRKLKQREEQQQKRIAELQRIRSKHQQDMNAYSMLDEKLRQKNMSDNQINDYFVKKGAEEMYHKYQSQINQYEDRKRHEKQAYIKNLSQQLNQDTYRQEMQRKSQLQSQKNSMEARNKYYSEMDKLNQMKKYQQNRKMLETLKGQVKPRKLLPDPEVPENVGLGSPVNIGKVVSDDRKRQLDWIERSLLRQLFH